MDTLTQFFDHYVINARLKPTFFVLLPLVVTILAWYPEAQAIGGVVVTSLITFGVLGFLSGWISNAGNTLQEKLFAEWGGAPSTALMRFSDTTLDHHTKLRYHQQLEMMVSGLMLPNPEQERADPVLADQTYVSATNFLREYTRDKKKFPMIYSDNVAYGFARNLLTIRWFGVLVSFVCLLTNVIFIYLVSRMNLFGTDLTARHSMLLGAVAATVSLISLIIFLLVINREYVKGRASRYAKSLLAACEVGGIPKHTNRL